MNAEAQLIGHVGEHLDHVVLARAGTRAVYVSPAGIRHIEQHRDEFDVDRALRLAPDALAAPLVVYQGKKATSLTFVGLYDDQFYLIVPVKVLPGELWLETLYITSKRRFTRRRWAREPPLYSRG